MTLRMFRLSAFHIVILSLAACAPTALHPSPLSLLHSEADETREWFRQNPPDGKNMHERRMKMAVIQTFADALPPGIYDDYMKATFSNHTLADHLEEHPALYYLRHAVDEAFEDIRKTRVSHGLVMWHIYNMGYVFKTPTACFAVDLKAPYAARLADSIDFLLATHQHGDHSSADLIDAMIARGKPVVTFFDKRSMHVELPPVPATATAENPAPVPAEKPVFHFGDITVKIDIGDHKKNPPGQNNMLMFQIDTPENAGGLTLYHSGDGCNYKKIKPDRPVDIFMPHIAVGMKVSDAIEHFHPKLTLASHVLELGHSTKPPHAWRWSYEYAIGTIEKYPQDQANLLTWGERYVTAGTKLQAANDAPAQPASQPASKTAAQVTPEFIRQLPKLPAPRRRPSGVVQPDLSQATLIAHGHLLFARDPDRRPSNLLFIQHGDALHIYDTAAFKHLTPPQEFDARPSEEGGILLPEKTEATLIGCTPSLAILAQSKTLLAINLRTFRVEWSCPIPEAPSVKPRVISALERPVTVPVNHSSDPRSFRLLDNALLVLSEDKIQNFNPANGKSVWAGTTIDVSFGIPKLLAATNKRLVVFIASGNLGQHTLALYDIPTGRELGSIKLEDRIDWAAIDGNGRVFVVTEKFVACYDSDNLKPVWSNTEIHSHYPVATTLTSEGLVVVNGFDELLCVSHEKGEIRWPEAALRPLRLQLGGNGARSPFLRTFLVNDNIIYMSGQGIGAYSSVQTSPTDDHVAWKTSLMPPVLPLVDAQLCDPYLVVLASGPVENAQRMVRLFFLDRKSGKLYLNLPLKRSSKEDDPEGPLFRNWQLADNGIAFEVDNGVKFCHPATRP